MHGSVPVRMASGRIRTAKIVSEVWRRFFARDGIPDSSPVVASVLGTAHATITSLTSKALLDTLPVRELERGGRQQCPWAQVPERCGSQNTRGHPECVDSPTPVALLGWSVWKDRMRGR